jgi:hypothetical protein
VFIVAVCLLVLDGLATAWLCVRRGRRRRLGREWAAQPLVATGEATRAARWNDDLARREALLQWQRSTHSADDTSPANARETVRRAMSGSGYEIRRAAELLAATSELVYDASIWET